MKQTSEKQTLLMPAKCSRFISRFLRQDLKNIFYYLQNMPLVKHSILLKNTISNIGYLYFQLSVCQAVTFRQTFSCLLELQINIYLSVWLLLPELIRSYLL